MRLEEQLRKPHRDACIEADAKAHAVEASDETEYRLRLWMHLYSATDVRVPWQIGSGTDWLVNRQLLSGSQPCHNEREGKHRVSGGGGAVEVGDAVVGGPGVARRRRPPARPTPASLSPPRPRLGAGGGHPPPVTKALE
jgi:hypothetical protein